MAVVELPLTAQPQIMRLTLRGVEYSLKLGWNVSTRCWVIDIADQFGAPLLCGVPLVTGTDLLRQFRYLGIGGQLLVISDQKPPDVVPGLGDLGVTGHVYFVTDGAT
jgi:hypothetical protein